MGRSAVRRLVLITTLMVAFAAVRLPTMQTGAAAASQSGCAATADVAVVEGEPLPVEEMITALRDCWAALQPRMAAAETDCQGFKAVVEQVLGWSRTVELLGLHDTFAAESAEIMPWRVRALVNCFNEAFEKCVDQHDVAQVDEMRRIERQLALLNADSQIDREKYDKCLRFEVAFEAVFEHIQVTGHTVRVHVRAVVPVQGRYDGALSAGERPLETIALTIEIGPVLTGEGCHLSASSIQPGAPFRVLSLAMDRAEPQDAMPAPPVRDVVLSFERGDTHERYSEDCPSPPADSPCPPGITGEYGSVTVTCGAVSRVTGEGSEYARFFDLLHEEERSGGSYTIRGWTMVGSGGVLARKVYQRSRPLPEGPVLSETTTFELRHTPVR